MAFERANTPVGVQSPSTHFVIFYLAFVVHKELRCLVVQQHMYGGDQRSYRSVSLFSFFSLFLFFNNVFFFLMFVVLFKRHPAN